MLPGDFTVSEGHGHPLVSKKGPISQLELFEITCFVVVVGTIELMISLKNVWYVINAQSFIVCTFMAWKILFKHLERPPMNNYHEFRCVDEVEIKDWWLYGWPNYVSTIKKPSDDILHFANYFFLKFFI